jgi:uncharacterized protein (TIGR02996 family)
MTEEEALLARLRADPDDGGPRMVFSDWLEERGDPRGELLRLTDELTRPEPAADRPALESRLRALLAAGVRPIGPRWTNSLGMEFAWVPAGTYFMGSPPGEPDRQENETRHRVTLTRGFYMGVHPVTRGQWREVAGSAPGRFTGDDRPVEGVSWTDCREFCQALTRKDGLKVGLPSPYRLPTEAEWEYACRGATATAFSFGDQLTPARANFHANYARRPEQPGSQRQETTPVGLFPANAWGLTDMHGNVFEWCADAYAVYSDRDATDPCVEDGGEVRILRGGSWHSLAGRCRSACRAWGPPGYRGSDVGCRVCFRMEYHYTI